MRNTLLTLLAATLALAPLAAAAKPDKEKKEPPASKRLITAKFLRATYDAKASTITVRVGYENNANKEVTSFKGDVHTLAGEKRWKVKEVSVKTPIKPNATHVEDVVFEVNNDDAKEADKVKEWARTLDETRLVLKNVKFADGSDRKF